MRESMNALKRFLHDESGATMIEYSIMAALIAAVCVLIVTALGGQTRGLFATVSGAWSAA
jgi:pilus assembly protein Flp/PilA